MFESKISILDWVDEYSGNKFYWIEKMLIPKKIGTLLLGFGQAFKSLRLLPVGHRFRGDVRI